MLDITFGHVSFNTGWYKTEKISFNGKTYAIDVCANAFEETDGITDAQRRDYAAFVQNKAAIETEIVTLLLTNHSADFLKKLKPTGLFFERKGGYALLLDDADDPDNGLAVVLAPKKAVMTQDEYL
jgi:hypothetical protein